MKSGRYAPAPHAASNFGVAAPHFRIDNYGTAQTIFRDDFYDHVIFFMTIYIVVKAHILCLVAKILSAPFGHKMSLETIRHTFRYYLNSEDLSR